VVNVLFLQPSPALPDHFSAPWNVAVYRKTGEVFVLDQWNNQVQGFRFDATANTFRQFVAFGHRGDTAADPEGLVFPSGIALDQTNGTIAIADSGRHRVLTYTYPFTNNVTTPFTGGTRPSAIIDSASPGQDVFGRTDGYFQQGAVAFDRAH